MHQWPRFLIAAAILLVFSPAFQAEFVAWDDTHNFTSNPRLNPPTLHNVAWFWANPYKDLYIPATYSLWSAVAIAARTPLPPAPHAYELNSYAFHALNVFLHILSSLLVYAILRSLVPSTFASCAGALAFALHPVQVESVAWASGTKDLLAGLLGLYALWNYLLFARSPAPSHPRLALATATAAFLLAMLAKPSAIVIPLVAATLDWLILRRHARQILPVIAIGLLLTLPIVITTTLVQPAHSLTFKPALWQRPLIAADALTFYLRQLVAPFSLAIDYGRSPQWLCSSWHLYVAWIIPAALAALLLKLGPGFFAASLCLFVTSLLPALGFVSFDFQSYSTTADHYLYFAMLAPALLLAAFVHHRAGPRITAAVSAALLLAATLSFKQCLIWQNSESLFTHTLRVNPNSLAANVNLGNLRSNAAANAQQQGNNQDAERFASHAIYLYLRALQTNPNDWQVHNNLALAYKLRRQFQQAAIHFRHALQLHPNSPQLHTSLGSMLGTLGHLDAAIAQFHAALAIDPDYTPAKANLAKALQMKQPTTEK